MSKPMSLRRLAAILVADVVGYRGAFTELVRFLLRNSKHLIGIIQEFRLVA